MRGRADTKLYEGTEESTPSPRNVQVRKSYHLFPVKWCIIRGRLQSLKHPQCLADIMLYHQQAHTHTLTRLRTWFGGKPPFMS